MKKDRVPVVSHRFAQLRCQEAAAPSPAASLWASATTSNQRHLSCWESVTGTLFLDLDYLPSALDPSRAADANAAH